MDNYTYSITFDNVSSAEANRYAEELRRKLLHAAPDIEVKRKRDDPSTQDFGSTLIAFLSASSITALATALGDWLKLRHSVGVTIKTEKGEIMGTNLTSKDVLKLAELLRPEK